jgi:hypothetical protein
MLLSQIGGRVARVRHPAIKYVITGACWWGLIHRRGRAVDDRRRQEAGERDRPAWPPPAPRAGPIPRRTARADGENYFKSMVGEAPAPGGNTTLEERSGRHAPPPTTRRARARQAVGL